MKTKISFGTDGWRALIGKDFNLKNVEAVAQAAADYLWQNAKSKKQNAKVALGYDTRRLSKEAAASVAQVLAANRIKVILSDRPLPTPAISYAVCRLHCTMGMMVTASHNPANFNGIKIKGAFGGPVENYITDRIEKFIFQHQPRKMTLQRAEAEGRLDRADLIGAYLELLRSYLDLPLLQHGRFKVLVDSMHGTADGYIARILKDTPYRVTTLHQEQDFSFGGVKPEPIESCLKEAQVLMRRGRFDVGLATDGDGDRLAALDANGRFISPQQIISLLLLHLIEHRRLKGAVVKTISGTALLERIAKRYKLKLYETPVGFKHISDLMQKQDVLIGGEEGGGMGFKNYLLERDGILAGLLLLEMMAARQKTLADLLGDTQNEFGKYVYLRRDLGCTPDQKERIRATLERMRSRRSFSGLKIARVKDYDGLKFYLNDASWILFRLSGTEPLLRLYAESDSLAKTKRLIAEAQRLVA